MSGLFAPISTWIVFVSGVELIVSNVAVEVEELFFKKDMIFGRDDSTCC